MKAVNLIPSDQRRGTRAGGSAGLPSSPAYAVIGLLAVALGFVTLYVLTVNTIKERQTKVTALRAQVAQEQAAATQLTNYAQFAQLAQTRAETVRSIAAARFDWHAALSDLSKVVPANTSLETLSGTVAPGAAVGGGSAGSAGTSLRGDESVPAIELTGCTKTQDDVARLMSRLRVINGVTRVTLSDSEKSAGSQSGAAVSSAAGATSGPGGCGPNTPAFDVIVFFSPLANAGPTGVTGVSTQPVSSTTTTGTATAPASGSTSTTTTSTTTTGATP